MPGFFELSPPYWSILKVACGRLLMVLCTPLYKISGAQTEN